MSTPPAITMPLPDPKYLRPSIDSDSVESRLAQNLLTAVYQNSTELVKFFLSKGAVIDRAVLIAAVWVRSPAIFQALLEHGWDINAPIMGNDTALLAVLDDEPLVRWFFDHGARLNPDSQRAEASAFTSRVYLDAAASKSSISVFDMLLDHGATREKGIPLHTAAGAGNNDERLPMMAHLVELGYDVNATDEVKRNHAIGTPLHYAIRAGSLAKARYLLQSGADPHRPVGLAGSPFKMAERMGLNDFVHLFE